MQLPSFEYLRPASLAEALALLAERGSAAKPLSGGSDLLVNMKFRLDTPAALVSFSAIPELRTVDETADGALRIGAACTLTQLAQHPEIRQRYPALRDAIQSVGSRHIRNVATLGGNLCLDTRCWYTNQSETWRTTREGCFKTDAQLCHVIKTASRCHALNMSDTAPLLIAIGASVELASHAGRREIPLLDFYREDGVEHTVLQPAEILAAVIVPPLAGRAVFAKLAQREGLDFAAGTFAASLTGSRERPTDVRMVMNSIAAAPKRLLDSERILREQGLTDAAIDAAALAARAQLGEITNLFTPSGYKRRLARTLIRDALFELRGQDGGGAMRA